MITVNTKISEDDLAQLQKICERTDRSKSYILRKALKRFLEDQKDLFDAEDILAQNNKTFTLEEVGREIDLKK